VSKAKVAIVIGDYSNGWNDGIVVQNYLPFPHDNLQQDMELMTVALLDFISKVEKNELINPKPVDEPCCKVFEAWAKKAKEGIESEVKLCPFCGTVITKERREKYFKEATDI